MVQVMSRRALTATRRRMTPAVIAFCVGMILLTGFTALYNIMRPGEIVLDLDGNPAATVVGSVTTSSSTSIVVKQWREQVKEACGAATAAEQAEAAVRKNIEIFQIPQADHIPALPRSPEKALKPCRRVMMDFGANIGDSSAHLMDSGFIPCSVSSARYYTHFNVTTKEFDMVSKRNGLTDQLGSLFWGSTGPEDYCYYGIEGNPVFKARLEAVEDFVMAMKPRPIKHMHFLTESVGTGQDGETKLYLDTVHEEVNFWGSSIFQGHQDVVKSKAQDGQVVAAKVMGYTIGTLMRRTLSFFDPNATEEEKKNNHLILKVDIEGGEYPMLQQAAEEGTLCEFVEAGNRADLFVEFHSERVTGKHEYLGSRQVFQQKLEECGVKFRNFVAHWK